MGGEKRTLSFGITGEFITNIFLIFLGTPMPHIPTVSGGYWQKQKE